MLSRRKVRFSAFVRATAVAVALNNSLKWAFFGQRRNSGEAMLYNSVFPHISRLFGEQARGRWPESVGNRPMGAGQRRPLHLYPEHEGQNQNKTSHTLCIGPACCAFGDLPCFWCFKTRFSPIQASLDSSTYQNGFW